MSQTSHNNPEPVDSESEGWIVSPNYTGPDRRRMHRDRRSEVQKAIEKASVLLEAEELAEEIATRPSKSTGLERHRGPGRRRSDFTKSAEEGEMTKEQFLFVMAIESFKQANGKMFPTWTDVLEVVRLLGYRKTCSSELRLRNAEDWKETADSASGVREGASHLLRKKDAPAPATPIREQPDTDTPDRQAA